MNKKINLTLILIAFVLTFRFANGQSPAQKVFAEIVAGPSFPMGKFAEKNLPENWDGVESDPAGAAKTGLALSVTGGYYLNSHLGILLSVNGSMNKQDADAFKKAVREHFGYSRVGATTHYWKVVNALSGIIFRDKLSADAKWSYQLRAMAGINFTTIPAYSWYTANDQLTFAVELSSSKRKLPGAFAFAAGAGLEYKLNNGLYLSLNGSYNHAVPSYSFEYNPNLPNPGSQTVKRKYSVASINTLVGIGKRF